MCATSGTPEKKTILKMGPEENGPATPRRSVRRSYTKSRPPVTTSSRAARVMWEFAKTARERNAGPCANVIIVLVVIVTRGLRRPNRRLIVKKIPVKESPVLGAGAIDDVEVPPVMRIMAQVAELQPGELLRTHSAVVHENAKPVRGLARLSVRAMLVGEDPRSEDEIEIRGAEGQSLPAAAGGGVLARTQRVSCRILGQQLLAAGDLADLLHLREPPNSPCSPQRSARGISRHRRMPS